MVCAPAAVANVAIDMAMNNTGTADTTRPDNDLEDMCFLGRAHRGAGFTSRCHLVTVQSLDRPRVVGCRVARQSALPDGDEDRKSTRLNSSHTVISYAVFCLK